MDASRRDPSKSGAPPAPAEPVGWAVFSMGRWLVFEQKEVAEAVARIRPAALGIEVGPLTPLYAHPAAPAGAAGEIRKNIPTRSGFVAMRGVEDPAAALRAAREALGMALHYFSAFDVSMAPEFQLRVKLRAALAALGGEAQHG